MEKSDIKKIIKEEIVKIILETGEPDQDYDHEIYNSIVDEIADMGYESYHREFDKYQGIYIQIKDVDKFWFDDISYDGDDVLFVIYPENDPDIKFEGGVYKSDHGEWIAQLGREFKEYLDMLKKDIGQNSKSKRRSDRYAREDEENKRVAEEYENNIPKLQNEYLKGKHLVITTPHGETYKVDKHGRIAKDGMKFSNDWFFIGLVRANKISFEVDIDFEDISPEMLKKLSLTYKNGNPKYTAIDWDHGTYRSWGNTKFHGIRNMYIM